MSEEWPFISDVEQVQAHYELCRKNGCTHALAEMLATRTFPGSKGTDRSFMQGRYHQTGGGQFANLPAADVQEYMRKASEAGVNPTGKWYSGGLARYPGDPRAWVDGLGDVKRVAEERGAEVSGAIEVSPPKYRDVAEGQPYRVADDLVQARVAEKLVQDPSFQFPERRKELEASLRDKMAGVHGRRAT